MADVLSPFRLTKALRRSLNPCEQELWHFLREGRMRGYVFRRQHLVGPYILSFYCVSEYLAVEFRPLLTTEADWFAHSRRCRYIADQGIRLIQFPEPMDASDVTVLARIVSQYLGRSE